MFLGKVIGDISDENPKARANGLKVVQKLDLYRNPSGASTVAFNSIGAGDGDIVIVGPSSSNMSAGFAAGLSPDGMIMGILERPDSNAESAAV